ncbi:MAG TPA: DUF1579 domain-containing protein [Rhodanobacteraceae bacterium]|nr:DUF1579 domain-containing protein [Rhodanobacteraceae bacterium]
MTRTLAFALPLVLALPAFAQDQATPKMSPEEAAMMAAYQQAAAPGRQHAELASAAGDYTLSIRSWARPGADPTLDSGIATRRMILGGRVMAESVEATMHGQPFAGHGMTGYDNVSGKWWGTWNDSMSTGLMVSEGSCDEHRACTFTGSWNDPVTRGKATARLETRWTSPGTEVFTMYGPGPDGKEYKMMEMTYTRR